MVFNALILLLAVIIGGSVGYRLSFAAHFWLAVLVDSVLLLTLALFLVLELVWRAVTK